MSSPPSRRDAAGRFHSAALRCLRRVRRADVELGVGPARLSALSVLVFGGPKSLGELATIEQVKPPTMTRIARGLEEAGLAERVADPADARVARLRATRRGRALVRRGRERRLDALEALLEGASRAEVAELDRAAATVLRLLAER